MRQHSKAQKPDSTRLRVLGVKVEPGGVHRRPRRLVSTTVVNHGKVYPHASTKRNGQRYVTDGRTIVVNPDAWARGGAI